MGPNQPGFKLFLQNKWKLSEKTALNHVVFQNEGVGGTREGKFGLTNSSPEMRITGSLQAINQQAESECWIMNELI